MLGAGLAERYSFPFVRGHAQELPLRDSILDGIFCECVLSILENPGLALREFARVLCPGGHLVLSDLYDRRDEAASSADHVVVAGCLKGIRTRSSAESIIAGAGLRQLVWEDHTQCLKELAAQLILNGISPDAYPASLGIAAVGRTTESHAPAVRPGYYLLVAKKT
jgi:SAM-dependent methyltransferase